MKLLLLAVLVIGVSIGGAALIVDEGPQGEVGRTGLQGERGAGGSDRAGVDYLFCILNTDVPLDDAKMTENEAWRAYTMDNAPYAEYDRAYDAYDAAYAKWDVARDECWATYQGGE